MQAHTATASSAPSAFPVGAKVRGVRTRSGMLSATEAIILALAVMCLVVVAFAPTPHAPDVDWSQSVTIKVERAQTLWGIAGEHPIDGLTTAQTVALIRSANHLDSSDLAVGQIIEVPAQPGAVTAMASR